MDFKELVFGPHPSAFFGGIQAKAFFANGYGASVIQSPRSYGGSAGLYELAVLKGDDGDFVVCYTTDITDDVLGYLSEAEVTALLQRVEALPCPNTNP